MKLLPRQIWFKWNGKESEIVTIKRIDGCGHFSLVRHTIGDSPRVWIATNENFVKRFGRTIEQAKQIYADKLQNELDAKA